MSYIKAKDLKIGDRIRPDMSGKRPIKKIVELLRDGPYGIKVRCAHESGYYHYHGQENVEKS